MTVSDRTAKESPAEQSPASASPAIVVLSPATESVLKTPELLELVLAHFDQEELLRAHRVCRRWKDVIGSSLPLRRMLYLSPISRLDERIPVDNAWLKRKFPDFGIFLLQGHPKWRPKYVKAIGVEDFERLGTAFFGPHVSWRDMLLTQPPVKELVVYSPIKDAAKPARENGLCLADEEESTQRQPSVPSMEEIVRASVTVRNINGITMGMIIDASVEARRRGSLVAKRRMSDRKDSGYVSLESSRVDDIAISVVEIVD